MLRTRRQIHHEINAGSMADIAFLMLVFFLLTSTLDRNYAFTRNTPPPDKQTAEVQTTAARNILNININDNNSITLNGRRVDAGDIKQKVIDFIQNPNDEATLPEKQPANIKLLGEVSVSKGIIHITTGDNTSYAAYISVNDNINKAFGEMRAAYCLRTFGIVYEKADEPRKLAVDAAIPLNITE